jgi:RNA polymerase sigma-70 factor (family 1)
MAYSKLISMIRLSYELPDEITLFNQVAHGDETAFTTIFYHYSKRIYPFVLKKTKSKIIAEEIVQEIFMQLWSSRKNLAHVENYESYIFTIAANKVYKYFKKIASEEKLLKALWNRVNELRYTIEEIIELKESEELIKKLIDKLPPQRKKIYLLSREQGLSHSEIAQHLNISTSTVNNQLTEALRFIKQYLQEMPEVTLALMVILLKLG